MKTPTRIIATAVAGAAVAASAAAIVALRLHQSGHTHHHGDQANLHQWLHEQLDLTAVQHARLEPVEADYEKARAHLLESIAATGDDLAAAVRTGHRDSPEIHASLDQLNDLEAELKTITLEHFFDMREQLDPAQAEKLLEWTHDGIITRHDH